MKREEMCLNEHKVLKSYKLRCLKRCLILPIIIIIIILLLIYYK